MADLMLERCTPGVTALLSGKASQGVVPFLTVYRWFSRNNASSHLEAQAWLRAKTTEATESTSSRCPFLLASCLLPFRKRTLGRPEELPCIETI